VVIGDKLPLLEQFRS